MASEFLPSKIPELKPLIMKIGILTHYDVNNQGAQLQLYALYMKLKEMGHQPVVLTYRKNYDFDPVLERRNQITFKSVPYILQNFLLKKGLGLTWHNVKKFLIHRKFRRKTFCFASYCLADVDAAVVGADEVFSLELGVNIMMFGHAVNTGNLIAYAPSAGQTDIERVKAFHCEYLMASGLESFRFLSVRDRSTADLVEKLTGKYPAIVCDPVILYDFSKINVKVKRPSHQYMVVYGYDRHFVDEKEIAALKAFAKKHGLLIVSPGCYHSWCDWNISCDALQWVELFKHAECVVTDTFHGTIVSVITNRPVAVYVRQAINSNKLTDLLERLGISDRRITDFSSNALDSIFSKTQNYQVVNECILCLRKEGESYLENALCQCQSS